MPEIEHQISEFNDAVFQIERLHNLWNECKYLRQRGRLIAYYHSLDSVEIELYPDAIRLDKESGEKAIKWIESISSFNKEIKEAYAKHQVSTFYQKLMDKEKLLRSLQFASGKGGKYKNEDDDFGM